MNEFFGSIWWLLVTLGLLITFHEYGHFVVARRLGVKVLRFSIGFGQPLWRRLGRDGVEWVVAAVPLGGYVKMLDEREGDVPARDLPLAYNRQPVASRMAIAAAGPLFNLVFAIAAFWLMYTIGRPDYLPIVGRAEAVAASAGFKAGDRITAVDGRAVGTWSDAAMALAHGVEARTPLDVAVTEADGSERVRHLAPGSGTETPSLLALGLYPKHLLLPALVGKVRPGSHAEAAGIKPGDRIVAIEDQPIENWDEVGRSMQRLAHEGSPLRLTLERNAERLTVQPVPVREKSDDGKPVLRIGLEGRIVDTPYDTVLRYGPLDALFAACGETWRMSGETLALVGRMVTGNASLKNLSGPISIAQFANDHAKLGLAWFLSFLAVISLSLAIMNLLPIPVLDGGHLLYYLIELVKGSPVSERTMAFGQYLGLALLAGLMGLAFYNDILRLVS